MPGLSCKWFMFLHSAQIHTLKQQDSCLQEGPLLSKWKRWLSMLSIKSVIIGFMTSTAVTLTVILSWPYIYNHFIFEGLCGLEPWNDEQVKPTLARNRRQRPRGALGGCFHSSGGQQEVGWSQTAIAPALVAIDFRFEVRATYLWVPLCTLM